MRHGGQPQEDIDRPPNEEHSAAKASRRLRHVRAGMHRRDALPAGESDEFRLFRSLGLGKPDLDVAGRRAERNGTSLERELLAHGSLDARTYYETLARILGLRYLDAIPPESVVLGRHADSALRQPRLLPVEMEGHRYYVIAPEASRLDEIKAWMQRRPALADQLVVAAPSVIREAVWSSRAPERVSETVRRLFENDMADSARIVLTGSQGFVMGLLLAAILGATVLAPSTAAIVWHVLLSVFFFACIVMRFAALAFSAPAVNPVLPSVRTPGLPVYTVAVALYREAEVIDQLLGSLSRLNWPRSLLEIKLICEEDDAETLAALARHDLPPEYEVIRVPPMEPRTKPKALHYALNGARGDFLVIYDAEDRPHPDQLLEAYAVFAEADEGLACLQAPLVISNAQNSRLSAVFALEYGGLFRGLLPFLARLGLPLPLGGTSNHFRMGALRAAGAWDPFNVTEDADLGMRLFRRGYRGGVLRLPTLEDAPERLGIWMRQRTRWFKGWLQTWLVMMRAPRRLWQEMGPAGFVAFQILIGGMLCSALGHPLLAIFVCVALAKLLGGHLAFDAGLHTMLFGLDCLNFVGGYLVFILLARRPMVAEERRRVGRRWIWVPPYWVAMSAAAWLAVFELARDPFYWAKTPHGSPPPRRTGPRAGTRRPCGEAGE